MINHVIDTFCRPTPTTLATRALEEARLGKLQAYQALDMAQAMVTYHEVRERRLRALLAENEPTERQVWAERNAAVG